MYLQPVDLKGKIIKDAYTVGHGYDSVKLVIEFSDGTKIELPVESQDTRSNGFETLIRQIL